MKITINAVGDISLGDYNMFLGSGVGSRVRLSGSEWIFSNVAPVLRNADIVFGNLETVLSERGRRDKAFESAIMRGSPSAISGLTGAGFSVMSVANNHMMQHGWTGFEETCELLSKNGIYPLGVSGYNGFSSKPVIIQKGSRRVGFLGYSFVSDRFSLNPLYAKGDRVLMKQDIEKLQDEADVVILSIHWGLELMASPSNIIRSLGRFLIDSGADIILGHHPHVVQNVESHNKGIIFYSLGNFVFDMPFDNSRNSIIAQISIDNSSIDFKLLPIRINDKYQPAVVDRRGERRSDLDKKLMWNGAEYGSSSMYDEELNFEYYKAYEKLRRRDRFSTICQFVRKIPTTPLKCSLKILKSKLLSDRN